MSTPTPMPAPSAAAKIRRNMIVPSVTGEADGVTGVVRGVVQRLQWRETGPPDEQGAEQDRGEPVTHRVAARIRQCDRTDQSGHFVLLRPPPEDRDRGQRRRQVSCRPGQRLVSTFPERAPVDRRGGLPLTVAGAAAASSKLSPRSLLRPTDAGT